MYKFTSHLTNSNLFLVRKRLSDGTCASLIVMRAPARQYAKDYKPNTPRKSHKLLFGAIGATVLTGAAVVYAKSSTDARNWLETNAPWANDFVALVYQENTTYWQFSVNQFNNATSRISQFIFGKEGITPLEFQPRSEQNLDKDAEKAYAPKQYDLPPPVLGPLYVEEKKIETPDVDQPSTLVRTEKCDPQESAKVDVSKDLVELEHQMHENTKVAIENYKQALKLCENYNKALFRIVESPLEGLDKKQFEALKSARNERDRVAALAAEGAVKAKRAIESLDRMFQAGMAAPPEQITMTKRFLSQFREDISKVEKAYKEELEKAVLSDRYWNKVEEARGKYKEELQILFPGIDLSARRLNATETDLLLLYTMRQIQFLQNELAGLQTIREQKINTAIDCRDEKAIIEAKVEDMIKRERLEKERDYQVKVLAIEADAVRKIKDELKKQYEIHQEVMQDRLLKQEKEILSKFNIVVSEKVEAERLRFKKELAAMAGKLQALEQTLKQRAAAEAEARRSQSVWAAAEALLAATRRAAAVTEIGNELKALEKAGEGDKLVESVLKGISPEAREKGILTEKSLKERFEQLEKTACKVALIGREGGSLPIYFLSWLQSKFLFQKLAEIPQDELNNMPTDFTKLDTFDIIQRARYFMDHGNISHALRYINLLQGAPRAAAMSWVDAARSHLEIRQAAETVMAHASLSGQLDL